MKNLVVSLTLFLAAANAAHANVYIKTVSGSLVEVSEDELQKANRAAGFQCEGNTPPPPPSAPASCQPAYVERQGYAVFNGDSQLTDFSPTPAQVIAAYQRLVLRGTCGLAQLKCDLVLNGYSNDYMTINGRPASQWGDDRTILGIYNQYRDANICK